eukprot:gene7103-1269_t
MSDGGDDRAGKGPAETNAPGAAGEDQGCGAGATPRHVCIGGHTCSRQPGDTTRPCVPLGGAPQTTEAVVALAPCPPPVDLAMRSAGGARPPQARAVSGPQSLSCPPCRLTLPTTALPCPSCPARPAGHRAAWVGPGNTVVTASPAMTVADFKDLVAEHCSTPADQQRRCPGPWPCPHMPPHPTTGHCDPIVAGPPPQPLHCVYRRLICKGKVLKDHLTLDYYGINDSGIVIHLAPRAQAPTTSSSSAPGPASTLPPAPAPVFPTPPAPHRAPGGVPNTVFATMTLPGDFGAGGMPQDFSRMMQGLVGGLQQAQPPAGGAPGPRPGHPGRGPHGGHRHQNQVPPGPPFGVAPGPAPGHPPGAPPGAFHPAQSPYAMPPPGYQMGMPPQQPEISHLNLHIHASVDELEGLPGRLERLRQQGVAFAPPMRRPMVVPPGMPPPNAFRAPGQAPTAGGPASGGRGAGGRGAPGRGRGPNVTITTQAVQVPGQPGAPGAPGAVPPQAGQQPAAGDPSQQQYVSVAPIQVSISPAGSAPGQGQMPLPYHPAYAHGDPYQSYPGHFNYYGAPGYSMAPGTPYHPQQQPLLPDGTQPGAPAAGGRAPTARDALRQVLEQAGIPESEDMILDRLMLQAMDALTMPDLTRLMQSDFQVLDAVQAPMSDYMRTQLGGDVSAPAADRFVDVMIEELKEAMDKSETREKLSRVRDFDAMAEDVLRCARTHYTGLIHLLCVGPAQPPYHEHLVRRITAAVGQCIQVLCTHLLAGEDDLRETLTVMNTMALERLAQSRPELRPQLPAMTNTVFNMYLSIYHKYRDNPQAYIFDNAQDLAPLPTQSTTAATPALPNSSAPPVAPASAGAAPMASRAAAGGSPSLASLASAVQEQLDTRLSDSTEGQNFSAISDAIPNLLEIVGAGGDVSLSELLKEVVNALIPDALSLMAGDFRCLDKLEPILKARLAPSLDGRPTLASVNALAAKWTDAVCEDMADAAPVRAFPDPDAANATVRAVLGTRLPYLMHLIVAGPSNAPFHQIFKSHIQGMLGELTCTLASLHPSGIDGIGALFQEQMNGMVANLGEDSGLGQLGPMLPMASSMLWGMVGSVHNSYKADPQAFVANADDLNPLPENADAPLPCEPTLLTTQEDLLEELVDGLSEPQRCRTLPPLVSTRASEPSSSESPQEATPPQPDPTPLRVPVEGEAAANDLLDSLLCSGGSLQPPL